jgi:hypothetical protein
LFQQKLVCSSLGQSSTRSCRISSCFSYLNPEKSYGTEWKKLRAAPEYRQILIPRGRQVHTFRIFTGSGRPDPFINQGLGCTQSPNG